MDNVTRYPLAWPRGWPRVDARKQKTSRFASRQPGSGLRSITMALAVDRLDRQLDALGGSEAILSTNLKIGLRGDPLSGQPEPPDRGVAVYFRLNGKDRVLACDAYLTVAGNVAAIAAHIEAIRAIERYGVGTLDQAFTGYDALPPPGPGNRPDWRSALGFPPHSTVTPDDVRLNFRALAKYCTAPSDEAKLKALNLARDAALQELGVK